jgi:hypothetical protein
MPNGKPQRTQNMTTLSKSVTRKAITRPAAHGVRAELIIALHPGGIVGIRECGRRSKSEVHFDAAELYVEGIRRRIANQRADKRKARLARRKK